MVVGGPQTGADFAGLPFDHLLFTGATSVARHVMRAAADNLVPVTLELGGKSPVIVGRSADIEKTTDAIMAGKMMNAGQICLAPDYVFVPKENVGEFVESTQRSVKKMFASLIENDDYTSIVNQRHFDRLNGYVEDAKQKGARVVEINPANEDFRQQPHHKIPPTLILDANDSMKVMQDEIFGPLMPVQTYDDVSEAVDYVNGHARPLGLYYFGTDDARATARAVAHDVGRRHRQRRDHARCAGGSAVRRCRSFGHGRVSRSRRIQDVQPCEVDLHAVEDRLAEPGRDCGRRTARRSRSC